MIGFKQGLFDKKRAIVKEMSKATIIQGEDVEDTQKTFEEAPQMNRT